MPIRVPSEMGLASAYRQQSRRNTLPTIGRLTPRFSAFQGVLYRRESPRFMYTSSSGPPAVCEKQTSTIRQTVTGGRRTDANWIRGNRNNGGRASDSDANSGADDSGANDSGADDSGAAQVRVAHLSPDDEPANESFDLFVAVDSSGKRMNATAPSKV